VDPYLFIFDCRSVIALALRQPTIGVISPAAARRRQTTVATPIDRLASNGVRTKSDANRSLVVTSVPIATFLLLPVVHPLCFAFCGSTNSCCNCDGSGVHGAEAGRRPTALIPASQHHDNDSAPPSANSCLSAAVAYMIVILYFCFTPYALDLRFLLGNLCCNIINLLISDKSWLAALKNVEH
jgi:hypothetical protein